MGRRLSHLLRNLPSAGSPLVPEGDWELGRCEDHLSLSLVPHCLAWPPTVNGGVGSSHLSGGSEKFRLLTGTENGTQPTGLARRSPGTVGAERKEGERRRRGRIVIVKERERRKERKML